MTLTKPQKRVGQYEFSETNVENQLEMNASFGQLCLFISNIYCHSVFPVLF